VFKNTFIAGTHPIIERSNSQRLRDASSRQLVDSEVKKGHLKGLIRSISTEKGRPRLDSQSKLSTTNTFKSGQSQLTKMLQTDVLRSSLLLKPSSNVLLLDLTKKLSINDLRASQPRDWVPRDRDSLKSKIFTNLMERRKQSEWPARTVSAGLEKGETKIKIGPEFRNKMFSFFKESKLSQDISLSKSKLSKR
jgi:hypothetical protein